MKNNDKFEIRFGSLRDLKPESRTIEGYAIVTNSRSELLDGFFYEQIAPEALNEEFINSQDIRVLYDHMPERGSLARFKKGEGTLRLNVDDKGLLMSFDAPKTPFGDEMLDAVRRGDIDRMSFCFATNHDEWEELEDGNYLRTIRGFERITEVSILDVAPAYPDTSVATRSLDDFKKRSAEDEEEDEDKETKTEEEKPTEDEETKSTEENEETPKDEETKSEEDEEPKTDEEESESEDKEDEEPKSEDEETEEDESKKEEEKSDEDEEEQERKLNAYYDAKFALLDA